MNVNKAGISYPETGYFSKTVTDYLNGEEILRPFYGSLPTQASLEELIDHRKAYDTPRDLLADALVAQYQGLEPGGAVSRNLELLRDKRTFTITTAHQPNIFTGPLYFIYKILHAIKLAAYCKEKFPDYEFVPVYYMGSEDADLDELGHIYLHQEKLNWETSQSGAVGRMLVDTALLELLNRISAEISVTAHGKELVTTMKACYREGTRLQDATRDFVHALFGRFGLIVLIPDDPRLKSVGQEMFVDELLHQRSAKLVEETAKNLTQQGYKAQTHGRDINLFYLTDEIRQRIEKQGADWQVVGTDIVFDQEALLQEVAAHPERISPNVILRGLFQEMILPNLIFIGGGGELAYWLELKAVFEQYQVPYPMLVLRNSFLLLDSRQATKMQKLDFTAKDFFGSLKMLEDQWLQVHGQHDLSVTGAIKELQAIYGGLERQAKAVSATLPEHVQALKKQATDKIETLAKKLLRAEKRNHQDAMRQIARLKSDLFPFNSLQERIENFSGFYATYGPELLDILYTHSPELEGEFRILEIGQSN